MKINIFVKFDELSNFAYFTRCALELLVQFPRLARPDEHLAVDVVADLVNAVHIFIEYIT